MMREAYKITAGLPEIAKTRTKNIVLLLLGILCFGSLAKAQNCGSSTPVVYVDLRANPDSVWVSASMSRSGKCCGASGSQRCIRFVVQLSEDAGGLQLDVGGGAGNTHLSLDCSTTTSIGSLNCVNGGGTHELILCKPGNNKQNYTITSFSSPSLVAETLTTTASCPVELEVEGLKTSTIQWTSLTSSAYNSWLSCASSCAKTTVTPALSGYPAYIDFLVTGYSLIQCDTALYRDTVRVIIKNDPLVSISPDPAIICPGNTDVEIAAGVTGGIGPFSYHWSNAGTDTFIVAPSGTYTVTVQDLGGCASTADTVKVALAAVPSLDAGNDTAICESALPAQLSGTAVNLTGSKWSGGSGTFTPNDSDLSAQYAPTSAEIQSGGVKLYLAASGLCGTYTDSIEISINPVPEPEILGDEEACISTDSFFYQNASVISGRSYLWNISGGVLVSGNTGSSTQAVWSSNGTQNIRLTETIISTGCSVSTDLDVDVYPHPSTSNIEH